MLRRGGESEETMFTDLVLEAGPVDGRRTPCRQRRRGEPILLPLKEFDLLGVPDATRAGKIDPRTID